MYDHFFLNNQDILNRQSKTTHYYLTDGDIETDRLFVVPKYDEHRNFIFTHTNGTDAYYLLNKNSPSIDVEAKLIDTDRTISCCYDIVFISNGEENAEVNFERLRSIDVPNKIRRVKNVLGRNNAYKEAARVSESPYFFAVFGKLEINTEFDFSFGCAQFDKRHYVFRSTNPVNGLEYGHQGMILYNKEKVLCNPGTSIDFTMAQLYREIPIVSGISRYNYNPLSAWRTAFRECLKLCLANNEVNKARLDTWQTGEGLNSEYSIKGANDAISFYGEFKDNHKALMKSYDWAWLDQYFKHEFKK